MKAPRPRLSCALCRSPAPLCNSHILSEFLYKPSYDAKHRLHLISTDPALEPGFEQKGLREQMLCKKCETQFSRYEKHAEQVLFGAKKVTTASPEGLGVLYAVDYIRLRLFLLSLIWRMHESNLDFFSEVDLGPHAEALRSTLLAEEPLSPGNYPFAITAVKIDGVLREDMVLQPERLRVDHSILYRFIARGLLICIWMTRTNLPPVIVNAMELMRLNGTLFIIEREAKDIAFLANTFGRLGNAMNERDKLA